MPWCATLCALLACACVLRAGAQPAGYVDCTAQPAPVPSPKLCWDAARSALRANQTVEFFNSLASNTLNVTDADVYVPAGATVVVGATAGAGSTAALVNGSLALDGNASLALTSVNLTITGNLTVADGAAVALDASAAHAAYIFVRGCVVLANASALSLQVDSNASRALVVILTDCVVGAFGNVSTVLVQSAGTGGEAPPPGTSCLTPVGIAVLVDMGCEAIAPPPPPPPPPPARAPPIIFAWPAEVAGPAPTAAGTPLAVQPRAPAAPAPLPTSTEPVAAPPVHVLDVPLMWAIGATAVAVLVVLVVALVVVYKVRAARAGVLPYRDRVAYSSPAFEAAAARGAAPVVAYAPAPPRASAPQMDARRSLGGYPS